MTEQRNDMPLTVREDGDTVTVWYGDAGERYDVSGEHLTGVESRWSEPPVRVEAGELVVRRSLGPDGAPLEHETLPADVTDAVVHSITRAERDAQRAEAAQAAEDQRRADELAGEIARALLLGETPESAKRTELRQLEQRGARINTAALRGAR